MSSAGAYSVFRHLGSALWFSHDASRSHFMIYTGYYDASSKEEIVRAPLVVAGLGASEASWLEFEPAWRAVLFEHDVEFLDMAKCAQWMGHPYDKWNRDESIRVPFLQSLIAILAQTVTQAAVVRIVPADFNAVNAHYCLGNEYWEGAYSIATIKCMGLMEDFLWPRPDVDHIAHIVEEGDTGQGTIVNLKSKGWPVTVLPKHNQITDEWLHPFGGCDMVAYEYRKAIQTKLRTRTHRFPFRNSLRALKEQEIPTKVVYMSVSDLTAMCEADPTKYPRR